MGVHFRLVEHDRVLQQTSSDQTYFANDLNPKGTEGNQSINNLIYTINGEVESFVPSCSCGRVKGMYNIGGYCRECNTRVSEIIVDDIKPYVWLRQADGVAPFINPQFLVMSRILFSIGKSKSGIIDDKGEFFDTIAYLMDTGYRSDYNDQGVNELISTIKAAGIKRGYNHFAENLESIIEWLVYQSPLAKSGKSQERIALLELLRDQPKAIYSQFIPLPNKSLLIIEKKTYGSFMDIGTLKLLEAVRYMIQIDDPSNSLPVKQNRTAKCLIALTNYYYDLDKKFFTPKSGLFRKNIFGSRLDYTYRAVISSIVGVHRHDEIHIPWAVAINVFQNHLVNKLLRDNYTPLEALDILQRYNLVYNDYIYSLLRELIDNNFTGRGFPCIENRNPSLDKGSIVLRFITDVKKDVNDITVSNSFLSIKTLNADYDGDQTNFKLINDHYEYEHFRLMAHENNLFGIDDLHKPEGYVSLPNPIAGTTSNWLGDKETEPSPDLINRIKAIVYGG